MEDASRFNVTVLQSTPYSIRCVLHSRGHGHGHGSGRGRGLYPSAQGLNASRRPLEMPLYIECRAVGQVGISRGVPWTCWLHKHKHKHEHEYLQVCRVKSSVCLCFDLNGKKRVGLCGNSRRLPLLAPGLGWFGDKRSGRSWA